MSFSKFRYEELRAFCRQYPDKKKQADLILSPRSIDTTRIPVKSGGHSDSTLSAVELRERLLQDVNLIDECALAICNGRYKAALIANACKGKPYDCIIDLLPATSRNSFFAARRQFFELLNSRKP